MEFSLEEAIVTDALEPGIASTNNATASRLIRETLEADLIRPVSEEVGDKIRSYVPFWA